MPQTREPAPIPTVPPQRRPRNIARPDGRTRAGVKHQPTRDCQESAATGHSHNIESGRIFHTGSRAAAPPPPRATPAGLVPGARRFAPCSSTRPGGRNRRHDEARPTREEAPRPTGTPCRPEASSGSATPSCPSTQPVSGPALTTASRTFNPAATRGRPPMNSNLGGARTRAAKESDTPGRVRTSAHALTSMNVPASSPSLQLVMSGSSVRFRQAAPPRPRAASRADKPPNDPTVSRGG
jgi:hypothetical protein